MNAQAFLIAHGEKILVAVVFVICAWSLYGTYANEETKAATSLGEIGLIAKQLDQAYQNPGQPNLTQTRKFQEEIATRFQLQVPPAPVMAWLGSHPNGSKGDIGEITDKSNLQLFGYEIPTPVVSVVDRIGALEVEVNVPQGKRANQEGDFIQDLAGGVQWVRSERGSVVNYARQVGVYIEYREGASGSWKPAGGPMSPNGVAQLSNGTATTAIPGVKEWEEYEIRAKVIVAATGVTSPEQGWTYGREVLPLAKPLADFTPAPTTYADAKPFFEAFGAGTLAEFVAKPFPSDLVPAALGGTAVAAPAAPVTGPGMMPGGMPGDMGPAPVAAGAVNELDLDLDYYAGASGKSVILVTKASIYMALKRVTGGEDPTATVILKRLVKDRAGTDLGWTPGVEYKVKPGQKLGQSETLDVPWSNRKVPVDLQTPFQVEAIDKDLERVLFWEVRLKSVSTPEGFKKQFEVNPKTKSVDQVVLSKPGVENGTAVRLVELVNIPSPIANRWVYPMVPEGGVREDELFRAEPQSFEMPELLPAEPIMHNDHTLLKTLINPAEADLVPFPYVEMPDGRVIYFYPPENKPFVEIIPGSEAALTGGVAPGMADPGLDPGIMPDGDEPGMMPSDIPPEYMTPPEEP
ncbi:MAG: hypothetical protein PF961_06520 [Planctomycetota bacterium]|jgi:hypothetical protein|nr:hypothetical protein [Planctomycetota bacterium]